MNRSTRVENHVASPREPSSSSGLDLFTEYVDRLDPALFGQVMTALRRLLRREIGRRGLAEAPPHYLGVVGDRWVGEPLDELVDDAYYFIFVQRLRGLQAQRLVRPTLQPMVLRNVQNFLIERHRAADPIGYRIFSRLRAAIESLIEARTLTAVVPSSEASQNLGNATVLSFDAGTPEPTSADELAEIVLCWNDDLLPDLVLAETRSVPAVIERLSQKVEALRSAGIVAFRLGEVIAPLARDTRRRWASLWSHGLGEVGREGGTNETPGTPVLLVRPHEEPDWPKRLASIEACVASQLDEVHPPRNKRHLWKMWQFVLSTRLASGADADGPLPAKAEIGRQLQLSRDRVRVLVERLWPIVDQCIRRSGAPHRANGRPPHSKLHLDRPQAIHHRIPGTGSQPAWPRS